jgi:hypothetical protein
MKRIDHLPILAIFVFLLVLSMLPPDRSEAGSSTGRKFYLTKDGFTGAQALTACAKGYHMASLYEIFDVSNLRYNTILGLTVDDSGSGPPTSDFGWIRTGQSRSASSIPGIGNCFAWSSDLSTAEGTAVQLRFTFDFQSDDVVNPWNSDAGPCHATVRVWCVQN